MSALLVFVGGAIGSVSRYGVSVVIGKHVSSKLPQATFLVNVLGSFAIGILMSSSTDEYTVSLCTTGFMGGFTTFSTFNMEVVNYLKEKQYAKMILYVLLSFSVCIGACLLGISIIYK